MLNGDLHDTADARRSLSLWSSKLTSKLFVLSDLSNESSAGTISSMLSSSGIKCWPLLISGRLVLLSYYSRLLHTSLSASNLLWALESMQLDELPKLSLLFSSICLFWRFNSSAVFCF